MKIFNKYKKQYFEVKNAERKWAKKTSIDKPPIWCSVDLRDGNQALIIPMSLDEKLKFFKLLVSVGFKEIEVGFPAASETEYTFLRTLIENNMIPDDVTVQVLTQSREHIIKKTFEALDGIKDGKAIVHLYNSTSLAQREQVFKKSKEEIIKIAEDGAKLFNDMCKAQGVKYRYEYSPESFTGTEPEFALEICNKVLDIWKPTFDNKVIINLPVTVEHSTSNVYADQIEYMNDNLKYRENVLISLHPHNDRGTAVADAELGLLAGADRVEGTLFGNGERTGNVDIVTLALNMYSQGIEPNLDFTNITEIKNLYEASGRLIDNPYLWEGLFRIACLIKNKPMEEPVTALILNAVRDTENGSVEGCLSRQISVIRAAFAVYEYNTDRTLLQRFAVWCHYLEIEFEQLTKEDPETLYKPADLMEFLVRFYQVTGLKAVLRICTRLRAAAFNWTSALHTFQQSIPVSTDELHPVLPDLTAAPEDIDYDEKEKLINHAEILADGVRYSVFSGIFSGNGQDLAAGKVVWRYLRKHHHAICGGTTSNPYLCGNAPEQPISNCTMAAWVEAFASQLILEDSEWALNELIRIIFNGLEDCLNKETAGTIQKVNGSADVHNQSEETSALYARLTRAAAAAYLHAVTLKEKGICVNYPVQGRFLLMIRKQI